MSDGESDFVVDDAGSDFDEDYGGGSDFKEKPASKKRAAPAAKKPAAKKTKKAAPAAGAGVATTPSPSKAKKKATSNAKAKPSKATKTVKEADADTYILKYLNGQNKPYSVLNIFDNLHHIIKRPVCQRVLDNLADKNKVKRKEFGKSKLYYPNQEQYGEVTPDDLAKVDADTKALTESITALKAKLRPLERTTTQLSSSYTDEQLDAVLAEKEKKVARLESTLEQLQASVTAPVSPEAKATLTAAVQRYFKEWKDRRRKAMDMVDMMAGDGPLKNVINKLGLEMDKDAGLDIKTYAF